MAETDQPKTKKNRPLLFPYLKNIKYRKGKFLKYRINYGANTSSFSSFYLKKPSKEEISSSIRSKEDKVYDVYTKPPKKKKSWLSFLYLAINIAVVAIILAVQLSNEENPQESILSIQNLNVWFILAAFGCFVGCMIMDQIRYSALIFKSTGTFRPRLSYKLGIVGRYYDVITPLGTGGQPFQIVYLNKYGIKPGKGLSISMGRYIYNQVIYFLIATLFLFGYTFSGVGPSSSIFSMDIAMTFCWIGYILAGLVIVVMLFMTFNKRFGTGMVVWALKLISKIRIGKFKFIKDYNKTFKSVMTTVETWQKTTKEFGKSPWVSIVCSCASVMFFMFSFSMPYFIYCAFEGWNPSVWLEMISMAVMVDLASSFNPIPMGTGTADISFSALFASFFVTGGQFWALIFWRILYYYIYILQGVGMLTYDYAVGNKRLAQYKEVWTLPYAERKAWKKEHKANKHNAK